MTSDTRPKQIAVAFKVRDRQMQPTVDLVDRRLVGAETDKARKKSDFGDGSGRARPTRQRDHEIDAMISDAIERKALLLADHLDRLKLTLQR